MLAERLQAKMSRDFQVADGIQRDLIEGGVFVHDGMKEWRADGVPYGSFDSSDGRGPGRTSGSRSDPSYTKSPYSIAVEGVEDSVIDALVAERLMNKMMRSYDNADSIREELRSQYNVLVDDR
jgi:cysteinyl-tRNA synthetase